jgi:hypothetical protein
LIFREFPAFWYRCGDLVRIPDVEQYGFVINDLHQYSEDGKAE